MMINKNVKRVLISALTAGMMLGCLPVYAQSETESEMMMPTGGFNNEGGQSGFAGQGRGSGNGGGRGPMGQGNGNMGGQAQTDPALQAVIDESASKFDQFTYTDEETGITLEYSLYIPEGYEEGTDDSYPMVMFIPDSTGAGLSSDQIVKGYYGAAVWFSYQEENSFKVLHL